MSTAAHDPRPVATLDEDGFRLAGTRCTSCSYGSVQPTHRCPVCGQPVRAATFGPEGVVWSHTVVRIPFGDRTPPYPIAYVDLTADDGAGVARVLAHPDPEDTVSIGSTVRLLAPTNRGDVAVTTAQAVTR